MKVFKPGKLGVLTRCFEHGRRFYFGVSVFAFVPLGSFARPRLLPEVAMWKFTAERLGAQGSLDVGIPKSRGEFLVHGSGHAPGGEPQPAIAVRARVGPLAKELYLFGDRFWRGNAATEARPFTSMPIEWAKTYGGKDYARNPLGKGDAEIEIEGVRIRPLPNVESPQARVTSPRDKVEPASFGPLDIAWPQRTSLAGTYDQHWLENLFPGFARDVDWSIHNIAPRDQQRDGFWSPGERYVLENLHPSKPKLEGTLPNLKARVLVARTHRVGEPRPSFIANKEAAKRPPEQLDEIALALQTLWFFPDAEVGVLIFQGSTTVAEEDGADILHLLAVAEHPDQPKPTSHYLAAMAARMDPEYGVLAALREEEFLPELDEVEAEPDEDQQLTKIEGLAQQNLQRRMARETDEARAVIASYGLDPDEHGPPKVSPPAPPPTMQELPALIAKTKAEAAAKQAEIQAAHAAKQAQTEKLIDELALPGFTSQTLRDEQAEPSPVGPPTFTAAGHRAGLAKIAMDSRMRGTIIDELEDMIVDEKLYAQWLGFEQSMRETYRMQAHMQPPAPAMAPALREPTRARVREAIERGEDFSQLNFTGADLEGMDLRGADLRGAFLESAKLDGADLRGARLERAVLAHASLVDAKLDEAKLTEANIGKTRLERTSLIGVDLTKAIVSDALLERAVLQRARLSETLLLGAKLHEVDARGLLAEGLQLLKVEIVRGDFGEATLTRSNFIELDLRGCGFERAKLDACTFLACKLQGGRFAGAKLDNARFVEGCLLDEAQLGEATLIGANLRGSSMRGADLRKATLDDADLSECDLAGAKLRNAVARRARFDVADLSDAELVAANFMAASFARAVIRGADLRGANLHGADMARVRTDARVQLGDALLTKVRIHPRYVDPKEAKS